MDYKKKSLNNFKSNESYEEIDTRLASGWYVDFLGKKNKVKRYKTKEVSFKISKKLNWSISNLLGKQFQILYFPNFM